MGLRVMANLTHKLVVIRGAGDLASGVGICLHRAGFNVLMMESEQPMAIRRAVSFAQAVYDGHQKVSGIEAILVSDFDAADAAMEAGKIALMVKPRIDDLSTLEPLALVDGRMTKHAESYNLQTWGMVVGLGPGFEAGRNCHVIVETNRGATLASLLYSGCAQPDTGQPSEVLGKSWERVFFAPIAGRFEALAKIGDLIQESQLVGRVEGVEIKARFSGILRGILQDGLEVKAGTKLADIDPREERSLAFEPSDKALLIGQAVVNAILEHTSDGSSDTLVRAVLNLGERNVALVGAGGKTTTLGLLGRELPGKVLLSTSTKLGESQSIIAEKHLVLEPHQALDLTLSFGSEKTTLVTGPLEGGKWAALQPAQLDSLESLARSEDAWMLVEADGSKCRSLKAPAAWEPVIPEWTSLTLVLVGLSAIGKPLEDEFVHRSDSFAQISGMKMGEPINLDSVLVVLSSAAGGLKGIPARSKKVAMLNQLDTCQLSDAQKQQAIKQLHEAGFDFVWIGNLKPII